MSQSLNPARLDPARVDRTPTTARGPGVGGIVVAVVLHIALIGATLIAFQHPLEIADEAPPVVPVDLVTIAARTNIAPTVERSVKPVPKDDVKPPPTDVPVPTPAPTPPPAAEVAPQPPRPKPVELKPAPIPKPVAKPDTRPAPPDQTRKPKADDFSALLNKLTAPAATPRNARVADRTMKGVGDMNAATMDLIDALKSQIGRCWTSPPVAAPHPEQLRPGFHLQLNRDGTVVGMPQLTADSAALAASNPYMRAAVEAARRAIMECQPYKLPADKYDSWGNITSLEFDMSKMAQ